MKRPLKARHPRRGRWVDIISKLQAGETVEILVIQDVLGSNREAAEKLWAHHCKKLHKAATRRGIKIGTYFTVDGNGCVYLR